MVVRIHEDEAMKPYNHMNTRNLIAEFIGTFALIFVGAGALAVTHPTIGNHTYGFDNLVGVALAHGLVIIAFYYAYGHFSGAHINPAVTLGILIAGEVKLTTAIGYWIVQFAGGIIGALALKGVLPVDGDLGVTILADNVSQLQGLFVEIILTFILVNAIFNTDVSRKVGKLSGIVIGLTLIACIMMGGPLTRASLNPARTLGPAIASGIYTDIWVYFLGTSIGAILAALLYIGVFKDKNP